MNSKSERFAQRMTRTMVSVLAGTALAATLAGCAGAGAKTGQYVDDTAITAKVKTALLNADNLKSSGIKVTTLEGRVQLSGYAPSETEKRRAEGIARDVEGVRSVSNRIEIAPQ